ncbi:EamA domain-containing protein [Cephalotus follicularis]|uniref:WAT1-related protein n=1 Tax=Cephalotus follicularis TaxID=3775 RepID=A0A1Q3C4E9_CEPFO|nr:EamA domain-containing protein [Cephalotus follicularis]
MYPYNKVRMHISPITQNNLPVVRTKNYHSHMETFASYLVMVLVQLAYGGSNILIKISLERGLNQFALIVYRHIIALLLLGPLAYLLERKQRPSLSFPIIVKIFALASLGSTLHLNLYYTGLSYSSPTVASALSNVIPGLTFLIAILLGMEKVETTSARGRAKVLGTFICIGGSLIFTFWKGGYLFEGFVKTPLINIYSGKGPVNEFRPGKENWIKGSGLILISYIAWCGWLILQAMVFKVYPARLSMNTLICFFASLQSSLLALFFARNPTLWRLDCNLQLLTIIYCGVVISALVYYLQTWCISKKGPVFVAMFCPLLLVIVGIFSAIAFAERLHLSSLVGALFTIVGLYCVLWGKRTDPKQPEDNEKLENSIDDDATTNASQVKGSERGCIITRS